MTVYMVEGKQIAYPNPAFMLAKVTECKTLSLSYKPRLNPAFMLAKVTECKTLYLSYKPSLNQIRLITVAFTDSQTNR